MTRFNQFILHPLTGKVFVGALVSSYLLYLIAWGSVMTPQFLSPFHDISDHPVTTSLDDSLSYWTPAKMNSVDDMNVSVNSVDSTTQASSGIDTTKASKQSGKAPSDKSLGYPLSTVGKVFFTTGSGRNSMCSGTAVVSDNRSVVDTAGHCLYMYGGWSQNVIFCPLYENGNSPFDCWAARDLEVPSDWINAKLGDFHHDFGIAVVAPNKQGKLTDLVGGVGYAYNQPVNQPFYAYGYPATGSFDGETLKSCENSSGTLQQHGAGNVISIPCNMTGGSSGGPWFIQIGGKWYVNGHNDFIKLFQPGFMFSPYYDDTWHELYEKAQQA